MEITTNANINNCQPLLLRLCEVFMKMENQEYSNTDILNLFYIHGECHKIIERTCRVFSERFPHLIVKTRRKFNRIESNFLQFGRSKSARIRPKPVTKDRHRKTWV